MSAPNNQYKEQQHPYKMSERFLTLYVLVEDVGISNPADHKYCYAEEYKGQDVDNSIFTDKIGV